MKRKYKARQRRPIEERFNEKWLPEPNSGCWLWTERVDLCGYGCFHFVSKDIHAHRVAAHLWKGFDLNSRLYVCHKCDVPACVNPDHLFIGTQQDNMDDATQKGRRARFYGEINPRAALKAKDIPTIRKLCKTENLSDIAKMFNVTTGAIAAVKQRRTWKHI